MPLLPRFFLRLLKFSKESNGKNQWEKQKALLHVYFFDYNRYVHPIWTLNILISFFFQFLKKMHRTFYAYSIFTSSICIGFFWWRLYVIVTAMNWFTKGEVWISLLLLRIPCNAWLKQVELIELDGKISTKWKSNFKEPHRKIKLTTDAVVATSLLYEKFRESSIFITYINWAHFLPLMSFMSNNNNLFIYLK